MDRHHPLSDIDKDPVCGMTVEGDAIATLYEGIRYVFCSAQCRERFTATPYLYIGYPGHPSPRQRGVQVMKRRSFRLAQPLSSQEADLLCDDLRGMMGVHEIHADGDLVKITYDLMEVDAELIEARLLQIGLRLGQEWPEQLRLGFIHFLEESEVLGLEEPPH
ncbi:MAG TPA: YHS domain-containing protein [Methylophilaceae bacterium]|jgi:YHS domain-containing protein|nr:YHS domain-containing protein [Methylophilaceae bacterium]